MKIKAIHHTEISDDEVTRITVEKLRSMLSNRYCTGIRLSFRLSTDSMSVYALTTEEYRGGHSGEYVTVEVGVATKTDVAIFTLLEHLTGKKYFQ